MSFCSTSCFPANHCCFHCVSFHIPVLPFPPTLPLISRTSRFVSHSLSTLFPHLLFPPSAFSFSVLPFVPVLFMLVPIAFPPKILLSMPAPSLSSSVLPSLYPSISYFPVLWILLILCLYCVFLLFFTGIFLKNVFKIRFYFCFFTELALVYPMLWFLL